MGIQESNARMSRIKSTASSSQMVTESSSLLLDVSSTLVVPLDIHPSSCLVLSATKCLHKSNSGPTEVMRNTKQDRFMCSLRSWMRRSPSTTCRPLVLNLRNFQTIRRSTSMSHRQVHSKRRNTDIEKIREHL